MNAARRNNPKIKKDWRKMLGFKIQEDIARELRSRSKTCDEVFNQVKEAIGDTIELQNFDIWDGIFDEIVD